MAKTTDQVINESKKSSGSKTTDGYVFSAILKKSIQARMTADLSRSSRDWFRNRASEYTRINRDRLFKDAVVTNNIMPGKMYMYYYDAKTKDKLPYWDAFPLIFCISIDSQGYDGINLHYLPPILRARLMDALYTTISNDRMDRTTKLRISYNILKSASNMKLFKPCYKRYLRTQVKSQFIEVQPAEWDIALFLPTQKFQKASAENVWRDSTTFESKKPKAGQSRAKWRRRFK